MSSSSLSRQIFNSFVFVSNNVSKTRKYSGSVSSFVKYIDNSNAVGFCTIYTPYSNYINYFNKSNGLFLSISSKNRNRFFSTVPKSSGESLEFNGVKEDPDNNVLNAVRAYNKDKNDDISDIVEELGIDSEITKEKMGVEELFQIPDYHEYILTRISDVNGVKRSPIQNLLPVDYIQQMFIAVHDFTNLSWSATICLITVFFKILVLPIWCRSERSRRMNAYLIPKATLLQEKAKHAFATKNEKLARETQMEIFQITKQNSFIKGVFIQTGSAIIQGLMFGTIYGGLRLFAINPTYRPDFSFESCLWLDSLCLPDPYFILPSIFGILMTLVFEHNLSTNYNPQGQVKGPSSLKMETRQKYLKLFSRFGIIFFTVYGFMMPSSAFFYLIPSFLFQTILRYSCNRFQVARFLGIPLPIVRKNKEP